MLQCTFVWTISPFHKRVWSSCEVQNQIPLLLCAEETESQPHWMTRPRAGGGTWEAWSPPVLVWKCSQTACDCPKPVSGSVYVKKGLSFAPPAGRLGKRSVSGSGAHPMDITQQPSLCAARLPQVCAPKPERKSIPCVDAVCVTAR